MNRSDVDRELERESGAWSHYPTLMRELIARLLTGETADYQLSGIPVISVRYSGTFGYDVGVEGVADVPAGARVVSLACEARPDLAGQLVIGGGKPIPLEPGSSFKINPEGKLTDTAVVFTDTARFFVEYVIPSPEVD